MVLNVKRPMINSEFFDDMSECDAGDRQDVVEPGLEPKLLIPANGLYHPAIVVHRRKLVTELMTYPTSYHPSELISFGPSCVLSGCIDSNSPSIKDELYLRFGISYVPSRKVANRVAFGQALVDMCNKGEAFAAEIGASHFSLSHIRVGKHNPSRNDPVLEIIAVYHDNVNMDSLTEHYVTYQAACQCYTRKDDQLNFKF